jgi:hypothetical protein
MLAVLSILLNVFNVLAFYRAPSMLRSGRMNKADMANNEARRLNVAPGNAADQMDSVVNLIIKALRSGRSAELPGLGTIKPGKRWVFYPDKRKS